jgi:hypothetical protein
MYQSILLCYLHQVASRYVHHSKKLHTGYDKNRVAHDREHNELDDCSMRYMV